MFNWLFKKKEVEKLKEDTKTGFESVKKDINSVGEWIKHLDSEKNNQKGDIENLKEDMSSIIEELEGLKNIVSFINQTQINRPSKTPNSLSNKQTAVEPVQTAVQTPNLDHFSLTERAVLWTLLNTDMKLSYEDIAAVLGKEKSTIRGQINGIKRKSESIIRESIEQNGKKRVYIEQDMKEKLLKRTKVRVKTKKRAKKKEKKDESEE